ncbi:hypothetical protein FNAPI_12689 [Fusarium napiforme]|uniref:Uncharacterized protein n=1 Tax=Fusarium napiforme TaxID=42672 RepID=A0A8H5IA47_9HYPO|nr:hypothetical protein FNAPI_12689 [Fusarium napiforme]
MQLNGSHGLPEKPIRSGMLTVLELESIASRPVFPANTPDQLVALSSGGFAFFTYPLSSSTIPQIILFPLTHSNDSLMPALLVFAVRYG